MGSQFNKKDIAGQKFNLLTAICFEYKKEVLRKSGVIYVEYYWKFKCDCGNEKILRRDRVSCGKKPTTSCGCLKRKMNANKRKGFHEISGSQWYHIKKNAKKRNINFNISIEEVWSLFEEQKRKCALTGENIEFSYEKPWYKKTTASLDRIDSSRGYECDNIQWLHKNVNICKWDFSTDEFIEICRKVIYNIEIQKGD